MPTVPVILGLSQPEELAHWTETLERAAAWITIADSAGDPEGLTRLVESNPSASLLTNVPLATTILPLLAVLRRTGSSHRLIVWCGDPDDARLPKLRAAGAQILTAATRERELLEALGVPQVARFLEAGPEAGAGPLATPQILTCYSPKGGTGTTTVAHSLAVQLAKGGNRVLLIDFGLFGASAVHFRLKQAATGLGTVVSAIERDEQIRSRHDFSAIVAGALQTYHIDNAHFQVLLPAPPAKMERLKLEDAEAILTAARRTHHFIIVDTSPELSERNMAALLQADRIVVAATPDVACGWALHQFQTVLEAVGLSRDKGGLVINRMRSDVRFTPEELMTASGFRRLGALPDLYREVQSATNEGAPAVLRVKALEKGIDEVLAQLIPGRQVERRQGLWRWIG
jgi:MinD-like ATPase involved in chromosome partitioning or flagellar assembly